MGRVAKKQDKSEATTEQSQVKYEITVKLRNNGSASISYDTELASADAQERTPEQLEELVKGIPARPGLLTHTIKSGGSKELTHSTSAPADPQMPLNFQLTLLRRGKIVVGPLTADIPTLSQLPDAKKGEPSSAVYLKFKTKP